MANHSNPTNSSTYTAYTSEVNARIDDVGKMNSSTLTTATNLPTDSVRWDTTNLGWYRNTGTAGAPTWTTPLSTRYIINIDGTVGATTPTAGTFTTLVVNGPTAASGAGLNNYLASPPAIGGTLAAAGTFSALTVNTSCTLPAAAIVTSVGNNVVGLTATQTLSNKTLTAPVISSIVNTGTLTLPTTTTTLVGTSTTDTLSNKTLTAPRFASAGFIADANGIAQIAFTTTASAANYLTIANAAASGTVAIAGTGTNCSINLTATGTGTVQVGAVPIATTTGSQSMSSKTLTSSTIDSTPIGGTTPAAGTFTTLVVNGPTAASGAGLNSYLAAPPSIGSGTANSGSFTTLAANSTISGTGFINFLASPTGPIGTTTPVIGAFTAAYTPPVVVTFNATTMAINCALSNVFTITMTAAVTVAPTFTTPKDGQTINVFITQGGVGSFAMTWPANTVFKWAGGLIPLLSTVAGSVDLLVATYRAATGFWYVSLAKDFK